MDTSIDRSTRTSTRRIALAFVTALLVLSACGSSDDDNASTDGGGDDPSSAPVGNDDDTNDDSAPASGDGAGTLTMADGTVYEFVLGTCDTSDTNPDALPLTNGYDATGRTADDAFALFLVRAGFDDDSSVASGSLEGGFDEDGKNAQILYSASNESMNLLTVDGSSVSGDLDFKAIGPAGPHGDETAATVDITC